jgi:integrase
VRNLFKRATLFSALTGLRYCDIQKMQWKEIQTDDEQARLNFTQQKTKDIEYMPISPQALELCGEPRKPEQLVFEDLPDPSWISMPLKRWIKKAGITKKITGHQQNPVFKHRF